MTGVVYPVVARWVWHKDGWLRTGDVIFPGYPYQDFAGSSTVHLCGGVVALWGAVFCGPRLGRFDRDGNHDLQGHSIPVGKLKKNHHKSPWAYITIILLMPPGGSIKNLNENIIQTNIL